MDNVGYAALGIIPSFDGFQAKLEHGSSGALIAAGASGGRKYGDSAGRSLVSSFTSHAKRAALLGGALITGAGYAAFQFGKGAIAEAEEAQKVGALTAQVIKTTGQAANVTTREVGDLSEALSNKAGVDDEIIQRGANMILTFKNIRNEVGENNDIFNQATTASLDMAAAMAGGQGGGQLDLKSSSILVGKALNDPAKGLTALTRVGVSFTEQQKKNIESLLEQNKQSEAQKVILGELQSQFGGAAQAQATLGEKVDVAWGNIQERVGTVLLPMIRDLQRAFLREGVPALERFSDWFRKDGAPAIRDFVGDAKPKIAAFIDDVRPLAEEVLPAAKSVLGDVRDILGDAAPYAKDLVGAFNDMPDWAKKGVAAGGLAALTANKLGLFSRGSGAGGGILGAFSKAAPLPVYVTNAGFDVPGGNPRPGTPPVVPTGTPPKPVGTLPKWAPFIPVGLDSAPGQQSLFDTIRGKTPGPDPMAITTLPGGFPATDEGVKAMVEYRSELESTSELFKTLPHTLQTDVILHGAPESRREANKLAKEYDLTAKDRTTLFRTSGIPLSSKQVANLLGLYQDAEKPRRGNVYVDTGDSISRLERLLNLANSVNRLGAISVATGGGVPAPPSRRTTRGTRRRQVPVIVDGKQFDGYIHERIDTDEELREERIRAGAPR